MKSDLEKLMAVLRQSVQEKAHLIDADKSWEELKVKGHIMEKPRGRIWQMKWSARVAAIGLLLIVCGLVLVYNNSKSDPSKFSNEWAMAYEIGETHFTYFDGEKLLTQNKNSLNTKGITYNSNQKKWILSGESLKSGLKLSVAFGKKEEIQLPDGSLVSLNSGSVLALAPTFGEDGSRKVFLNGEALFTVEKDKDKPFFVSAPMNDVKVLGTIFNVRGYLEETLTTTSLLEGRVEVNLDGVKNQSHILKPNQQLICEQKQGGLRAEVQPLDQAKNLAWLKDKIVLKGETFEQIIPELERFYNIRISSEDTEVNHSKIMGTFKRKELDQFIETLRVWKNWKIIKNKERYTIIK